MKTRPIDIFSRPELAHRLCLPPSHAAPRRLAALPAAAQDKPVALKLSSWVPAQHPLNPSLIAWAEDIKKASGGTITATLFPSEQLGKAFDHYDMAKDGIADFAYINPGYQPGRFPVMAGAGLPFIFANAQERLGGDRRLVPRLCGQGDEGREVLLRLHPRPRHLPQQEEAAARRPTSRA